MGSGTANNNNATPVPPSVPFGLGFGVVCGVGEKVVTAGENPEAGLTEREGLALRVQVALASRAFPSLPQKHRSVRTLLTSTAGQPPGLSPPQPQFNSSPCSRSTRPGVTAAERSHDEQGVGRSGGAEGLASQGDRGWHQICLTPPFPCRPLLHDARTADTAGHSFHKAHEYTAYALAGGAAVP